MRRLRLSWRVLKTCAALVRRHRALRGLTGLMTVAWVAALLVLFGPLYYLAFAQGHPWLFPVFGLALAYPFTFLSVFFGVAIVIAAAEAEAGREPDVEEALAEAWRRRRQIAAWSLLATGVGVLLQEIAQRIPFAGSLASWLAGVAWSVVTLFVIPILALEGCSPRDCVRRSVRLFRARWGETAIGSLAIYGCVVVLAIPAGFLIGFGGAAGGTSTGALAAVAVGLAFLGLATAAGTLMHNLFALALYRYATAGTGTLGFDQLQIEQAIELSKRKRRWRRGGKARTARAERREGHVGARAPARAWRLIWAGLLIHLLGLPLEGLLEAVAPGADGAAVHVFLYAPIYLGALGATAGAVLALKAGAERGRLSAAAVAIGGLLVFAAVWVDIVGGSDDVTGYLVLIGWAGLLFGFGRLAWVRWLSRPNGRR